ASPSLRGSDCYPSCIVSSPLSYPELTLPHNF
ncbi:hypothetical protein JMJ77_0006197, partial [Colletotrichum scovillei]